MRSGRPHKERGNKKKRAIKREINLLTHFLRGAGTARAAYKDSFDCNYYNITTDYEVVSSHRRLQCPHRFARSEMPLACRVYISLFLCLTPCHSFPIHGHSGLMPTALSSPKSPSLPHLVPYSPPVDRRTARRPSKPQTARHFML